MNKATGQPSEKVKQDPLTLSIDALSTASTAAGLLSGAAPVLAPISGILSLAGGIVTIVRDSQKTTVEPDPYVNQLGDLLSGETGIAANAAITINKDLENANNTFFNGVESDWFKLQTIGLLSVNPNKPAWYQRDNGAADSLAPVLVASARKSFYMQTASQHFVTKWVRALGYAPVYTFNSVIPAYFGDANAEADQIRSYYGITNAPADYSWFYRDVIPYWGTFDGGNHYRPLADGVWDFNFVVLKNDQSNLWTASFGDTLMGPANSKDGMGNLTLNRDVLYDSGAFTAAPPFRMSSIR